jgi:hypothetical protein
MKRFLFFSASCPAVPMTSSIGGLARSARAIAAGLDRKKSRGAKKSPARAGLSLQEEPSNVTFTIDAQTNSAADCTRHVMGSQKCAFYSGGGAGRVAGHERRGLRSQDIAGHFHSRGTRSPLPQEVADVDRGRTREAPRFHLDY